ncbi:MAG: FAD:protein FMN transferase, partial [Minisyncoccia bacterium]
MRETRILMGMPITIEIADAAAGREDVQAIFDYFAAIDERFSPYKEGSEVSQINRTEIAEAEYSPAMREVLALADQTSKDTEGFFNATRPDGRFDPSGIVKGWALQRAAQLLLARGCRNFYLDAGGDIQTKGVNASGEPWSIGIRNPFNRKEIVKVLYPNGAGVATSGTAVRGQHIYNPHVPGSSLEEVVSLTVVGPDILEADRYATAAFAMGSRGVEFIERLPGFE